MEKKLWNYVFELLQRIRASWQKWRQSEPYYTELCQNPFSEWSSGGLGWLGGCLPCRSSFSCQPAKSSQRVECPTKKSEQDALHMAVSLDGGLTSAAVPKDIPLSWTHFFTHSWLWLAARTIITTVHRLLSLRNLTISTSSLKPPSLWCRLWVAPTAWKPKGHQPSMRIIRRILCSSSSSDRCRSIFRLPANNCTLLATRIPCWSAPTTRPAPCPWRLQLPLLLPSHWPAMGHLTCSTSHSLCNLHCRLPNTSPNSSSHLQAICHLSSLPRNCSSAIRFPMPLWRPARGNRCWTQGMDQVWRPMTCRLSFCKPPELRHHKLEWVTRWLSRRAPLWMPMTTSRALPEKTESTKGSSPAAREVEPASRRSSIQARWMRATSGFCRQCEPVPNLEWRAATRARWSMCQRELLSIVRVSCDQRIDALSSARSRSSPDTPTTKCPL